MLFVFLVVVIRIVALAGALGPAGSCKSRAQRTGRDAGDSRALSACRAGASENARGMINVNFSEEQIPLAGRISARVMTILDSQQRQALNKLS